VDFLTSLSIAILHRTCQVLYFCSACIVLVLQFALCIPYLIFDYAYMDCIIVTFFDFALVYDR